MTKTPCKNCHDRTVTCHTMCRRYQEWKKTHEEEAARIRETRHSDYSPTICERSIRTAWRNMLRRNRKYVK